MTRAANQHELYLEIMVTPDNSQSIQFGKLLTNKKTLLEKYKYLMNDPLFQKNIATTVAESKQLIDDARSELDCTHFPKKTACQLTVQFQYYVLREFP